MSATSIGTRRLRRSAGSSGQEDWRVVRAALRDRVAHVRPDEERVVAEAALEPAVHVGSDAEREDVQHLGVGHAGAALGEGLHERLRLGGPGPHEDALPVADPGDGRRGGGDLVGVPGLPVGGAHAGSVAADRPSRRAHSVVWAASTARGHGVAHRPRAIPAAS